MSKLLLYRQPGLSTIFLGDIELGEQEYTEPIVIHAKNDTVYPLKSILIFAEGKGAEYVELSSDGEEWGTAVEMARLEPAGEFSFQSRIKTPPLEAGPDAYKFEFVAKSQETV